MKPLILLPQFVDRGGNTVYHVHEDDPDCRVLKAGKLIGLMRFNGEEITEFEPIEQKVFPEMNRGMAGTAGAARDGVQRGGTG